MEDSPNLEVALDIIDFCARPENVKRSANPRSFPRLFWGVEPDIRAVRGIADRYKRRAHLPLFGSGIPAQRYVGRHVQKRQSIMAGDITASDFADNMKAEYTRLRSIAEG